MKKKNQRRKANFFKKARIVLTVMMTCLGVGMFHPTVRQGISKYSHMLYIHATSLEDAENDKQTLEEKKKETEEKIAKLEKKKSNILEYIEELDTQMAELDEELETLSAEISSLESDLEETRANLTTARETEENQYEIMKKRIKYMYENGNANYLNIFFQADSFYDMLNSAEYISKISAYDENLFQSYLDTRQSIETEEATLTQQLADLQELNEEYEYEKSTVEDLTADKQEQLKTYNKKIKSSEKAVDEYDNAIAEQEEKIEKLLLEERNRMYELMKKRAEAAGMTVEEYGELFTWPLAIQGTITSKFGPRTAPTAGASTYHKGVDIAAAQGTSVLASSEGKVVISQYSSSAGNYVMIYHGDDIYTVYMHMSKLNVKVGDKVKQGEIIGLVGSTGFSTGPHLHFGIMINGNYVNPLNYVTYESSKKVKQNDKEDNETTKKKKNDSEEAETLNKGL